MIKTAIGIILLGIATLNFGQGFYYWGKAELAQHLLLRAWEKMLVDNQPIKPWPWADIHPKAFLQVPRLDVAQVVLDQQHGEALAFGPGMALEKGSVVLAGHRDSHFEFLQNLKLDDQVLLSTENNQQKKYYVTETQIIDSAQHSFFFPPEDSLVLITCYPFNDLGSHSTLRYVVIAYEKDSISSS